jgi:hypothetical protein
MKSILCAAVLALLFSGSIPAAEPPAEPFEKVRARAVAMGETAEGKEYEKRFSGDIAKPLQAALQECTKDTKPPYTLNIVFVIGADGAVQRILPAPEQPVSACVAKKLKDVKLPAPPKVDWLVAMKLKIE